MIRDVCRVPATGILSPADWILPGGIPVVDAGDVDTSAFQNRGLARRMVSRLSHPVDRTSGNSGPLFINRTAYCDREDVPERLGAPCRIRCWQRMIYRLISIWVVLLSPPFAFAGEPLCLSNTTST